MKNRIMLLLSLLSLIPGAAAGGQYHKDVEPTRNLIFMISDGTSMSTFSAARWYKIYNGLGGDKLAVDPHFCGLVKTFCSNSPIPDSASSMAAYVTGQPQRAGNLSIYPAADPARDIIEVDSLRAYQPLATILEAAKYEQRKATGLVATVRFDHATPAACAAHAVYRNQSEYIIPQMASLGLDVVFAGGAGFITDEVRQILSDNATVLIDRDAERFRAYNADGKLWALFADDHMAYDLDRDDSREPSLAEMTRRAIERLSRNENGFFLMVEGSKVDYASHANDPAGVITEYLAFDKAVAEAMEFARRDGNTTVVVCADHGTGGMGFGSRDFHDYSTKGLDSTFMAVSRFRKTSLGLEEILWQTDSADLRAVFAEHTAIDLTDEEVEQLLLSKNYVEDDYTNVQGSVNMYSTISNIMLSRTRFAFISGNHTGEDVFLAAYHPAGHVPLGHNTNAELNRYLCDALGLRKSLGEHTGEMFVRHDKVFAGMDYAVVKREGEGPVLTVNKGGRRLEIPANRNAAYLDGEKIVLRSVAVYIGANEMFYLPADLASVF